jgi:glutamine phosphoribosylpyrophosphate amidotransferase
LGTNWLLDREPSKARCCGIVGYLGEKRRGFDVLKTGLKILQNRGYDSIGTMGINRRSLDGGLRGEAVQVRNQ